MTENNNTSGGDDLLPPILQCMCRECGALCLPQGWEDRGQLCARCAWGGGPSTGVVYMNGVELVGDKALRDAIAAYDRERDPIRDAIAHAWIDWAKHIGGDS